MRFILIIFAALFLGVSAFGQTADDALEQRAKEVGHALRCVVCQNQSIEESDASLAEDMRRLVRARLQAGDSNEDVINFMRDRYGDYVLLKPPVQRNTYVLWFAPFILVALCGLWFGANGRRRTAGIEAPLSDAEQEALTRLMDKDRDRLI